MFAHKLIFMPMDTNEKLAIEERIIKMLKTVYDPEIPVNIYDLGLVYKVDVQDDGETAMQESRKAQKQRVQQTRQQAAENNPDAPSAEMFRALMATLTERGCKEREDYLAELSDFFGREVKSSKELTKAEISEYLNACNGAAQDNPF